MVDVWIRSNVEQYPVHGLSVAIAERDGDIRVYSHGFSDVRRRREVTPTTLFHAASISKPLTATAAMIASGVGVLRLDDPLSRALPDWTIDNPFDEPVTIRRLMAHTAGMTGDRYDVDDPNRPLPTALDQLEDEGFPRTISYRPGSAYVYSPYGYTVLQAALERAYDREPFSQTMRRLVLGPFGMGSSEFEALPTHPIALPYDSELFEKNDQTPISDPPPAYRGLASGGLWTTPSDLVRFLIAFQHARSGRAVGGLTPELASEMIERKLGFAADGVCGREGIGHTGHSAGYLSLMFGDEARTVAVMVNSGPPMDFKGGEYAAFTFVRRLANYLLDSH